MKMVKGRKSEFMNTSANIENVFVKKGSELDKTLSKKLRSSSSKGSETQDWLVLKTLYLIRANHPWRVKWDLFIMVLSIWVSIDIPIEIAF